MNRSRTESARPVDEQDLCRRLPEIDALRGRVRNEVVTAFLDDIPEYFWMARASGSYHPPDERELGGVWLHTKRVFVAYAMLEPTMRELGAIDSFEANCARAAVLLHDAFKYGRNLDRAVDKSEHEYARDALTYLPPGTDPYHDVQMAEYIREETALPDEVARAVESHGGSTSWGSHEGPSPSDDLELVVHLADMLASNQHHRLPVYAPCDELTTMVGDVPVIEDDDWLDELSR